MKLLSRFLLPLIAAFTITAGFSQGTILFDNNVGFLPEKVYFTPQVPLNSQWSAQLLLKDPGASSLTPLLPVTTFLNGAGAGFVNPVEVTVQGFMPGETVPVVMRVWNPIGSARLYERDSDPFPVTLGGGGLPAGQMVAFEGIMIIIPEPSSAMIGASGAAVLLLFRRKRTSRISE